MVRHHIRHFSVLAKARAPEGTRTASLKREGNHGKRGPAQSNAGKQANASRSAEPPPPRHERQDAKSRPNRNAPATKPNDEPPENAKATAPPQNAKHTSKAPKTRPTASGKKSQPAPSQPQASPTHEAAGRPHHARKQEQPQQTPPSEKRKAKPAKRTGNRWRARDTAKRNAPTPDRGGVAAGLRKSEGSRAIMGAPCATLHAPKFCGQSVAASLHAKRRSQRKGGRAFQPSGS